MRRAGSGPALMVASAFTWALGTIASKHTLDISNASPSSVLVVELAASVAVLALLGATRARPARRVWRAGWVGLLEPGLAYQLGIVGLTLTSAATASVLGSLEPAIVPLFAWALFRQRPQPAVVLVVAGSTVGAVMVSLATGEGAHSALGDLLIVASVAAAALYVVLADRVVTEAPPLPVALTQQTWALAFVVVVTSATVAVTGEPVWAGPRAQPLAWAALAGVLNYALPFWFYLTALTKLPVSTAATYLTLIPVFGVGLSVAVLGEQVTALQVAGAGVVVVSLLCGTRLAGRSGAALAVQPVAESLGDVERGMILRPVGDLLRSDHVVE